MPQQRLRHLQQLQLQPQLQLQWIWLQQQLLQIQGQLQLQLPQLQCFQGLPGQTAQLLLWQRLGQRRLQDPKQQRQRPMVHVQAQAPPEP